MLIFSTTVKTHSWKYPISERSDWYVGQRLTSMTGDIFEDLMMWPWLDLHVLLTVCRLKSILQFQLEYLPQQISPKFMSR